MTGDSEEADRSLTAQQKSLAPVTYRLQLHSYQGSGSCRRKSHTWQIYINWMHWVRDTEDGGKERVQCSASVEVFTWCFHVCLPDCILGRRDVTAPRRKSELTNNWMAPPNFFTRGFNYFNILIFLFLFYWPVKFSIYNSMDLGRFVIGKV